MGATRPWGMRNHAAAHRARPVPAAAFALAALLTAQRVAGAAAGPDSPDDCAPAPAASDCWSDWANAPVEGFELGRDSNVYAAFALDALRPECAPAAARRLEDRLRATLALYGSTLDEPGLRIKDPRSGLDVHPFASWLAGAVVTHIFNAAFELRRGGYGLDEQVLASVASLYGAIPVPQDPGCGLRSLPWVNSCMDDFTLTASGDAWIAAYERAAGRDATEWIAKARVEVGSALSPMDEHGGGPCFFVIETLEDGTRQVRCDAPFETAKVMGADHGRENPSYGLGLMTGIASACAALYFADARCEFTVDESNVARELFRHAQEKASPDGSTFNGPGPFGCVDFTDPDGARKPCSDEDSLVWSSGGYRPTDFPVSLFYGKRGVAGMHPEPAFQFDRYCEPRGSRTPDAFWGPNRRAFYERLAWSIFR